MSNQVSIAVKKNGPLPSEFLEALEKQLFATMENISAPLSMCALIDKERLGLTAAAASVTVAHAAIRAMLAHRRNDVVTTLEPIAKG